MQLLAPKQCDIIRQPNDQGRPSHISVPSPLLSHTTTITTTTTIPAYRSPQPSRLLIFTQYPPQHPTSGLPQTWPGRESQHLRQGQPRSITPRSPAGWRCCRRCSGGTHQDLHTEPADRSFRPARRAGPDKLAPTCAQEC